MSEENTNIKFLIQACRNGNEAGRKKLYTLFFSYAMSISLRYSERREEAEDILNDAFFKVFSKIDQYDDNYEFKKWFRRVIINCSIDYYRKFKKIKIQQIEDDNLIHVDHNDGWDNLLYEDVLKSVRKLPTSYRLVFNLVALEGYKHREVAELLNISIGTSKSNYFKAKATLKSLLEKTGQLKVKENEG